MREDETEAWTCTLTWNGVLEAPYSSPFTWRDAVRHRNAVTLLARQLAFKEMGEQVTINQVTAHLKKHQARLIVQAERIIATKWEFEDWRFPRRA